MGYKGRRADRVQLFALRVQWVLLLLPFIVGALVVAGVIALLVML